MGARATQHYDLVVSGVPPVGVGRTPESHRMRISRVFAGR